MFWPFVCLKLKGKQRPSRFIHLNLHGKLFSTPKFSFINDTRNTRVKELPQTLLVTSEEIFKHVLSNKHLTQSIISNRQTLIVRRENAFCKFQTFFGFVYHVSCWPWFETKNKIRCIDGPKYAFTHRNLPES